MRLAAGVFSVSLMLLLIGYVIGYAVCLWRYQPMRKLWDERLTGWTLSSGTHVMPVVDVPDDFEPPPILPGD